MNQRLLWNFEFNPQNNSPLACVKDQKDPQIKWEVRYFWPATEIIILNLPDSALLNITNYQLKSREDTYYLLPGQNYNIKKRRNQLIYKPQLQQHHTACGFGDKILLSSHQDASIATDTPPAKLGKIIEQVAKDSVEITVKKEACIYTFSTKPKIKMELARLEVLDTIYFSLCIEGRSLHLVETLAKHLLAEQLSCDYVVFLKSLLKLC